MDVYFWTHDLSVTQERCRESDEECMENAVIRTPDWKFILDSNGLVN